MTITRKIIFLCFSISIMALAWAGGGENSGAEQSLLEVFPNSIGVERQNNNYVVSFCPDNTCTEFVQKNNVTLRKNAIIYLYYFGDYYDLEKWRGLDKTRQQIDELLTDERLKSCTRRQESSKACISKKLKERGLHVYYVRFDEGSEKRSKVW